MYSIYSDVEIVDDENASCNRSESSNSNPRDMLSPTSSSPPPSSSSHRPHFSHNGQEEFPKSPSPAPLPPPPPPPPASKSPAGYSKLVAPSPIFPGRPGAQPPQLGQPPAAAASSPAGPASLLSLIADRQSDLWAAAATASAASANANGSSTPKALPAPPPLFSFGPTHAPLMTSPTPQLPALQAPAAAANSNEGAMGLPPTWETLQETAARLLFMAVRWVKCLAPFQTLSARDQVLFIDFYSDEESVNYFLF